MQRLGMAPAGNQPKEKERKEERERERERQRDRAWRGNFAIFATVRPPSDAIVISTVFSSFHLELDETFRC